MPFCISTTREPQHISFSWPSFVEQRGVSAIVFLLCFTNEAHSRRNGDVPMGAMPILGEVAKKDASRALGQNIGCALFPHQGGVSRVCKPPKHRLMHAHGAWAADGKKHFAALQKHPGSNTQRVPLRFPQQQKDERRTTDFEKLG